MGNFEFIGKFYKLQGRNTTFIYTIQFRPLSTVLVQYTLAQSYTSSACPFLFQKKKYAFGAHWPKVQNETKTEPHLKDTRIIKDTVTIDFSHSFILFPRNKNTLLIRVSRVSVLEELTAVPPCELSLLNVSFALTSHLHLRHQ